jgi:hypothetical protein
VRFWQTVALFTAAFMVYVIYLNMVGFSARTTNESTEAFTHKPRAQPEATLPLHTQKQGHQKAKFDGHPVRLKAVVLASIPHDTGAFTQVGNQTQSWFSPPHGS